MNECSVSDRAELMGEAKPMPAGSPTHPRGAEWHIWDLHVHTPDSLVHGYGGHGEETWAQYIDELESLPSDIRVVGINDYWFIDGYRRVLAAKEAGRLANLDAIFPVVELRLNQFGGTDGNLSRANMHVIFDPSLGADLIESQFLNSIRARYTLAPGISEASWSGTVDRGSLADLGAAIKQSVPASELPKYGSDLIEGFNSLNISFETLADILSSSYLRDRHILGIGKAEWADIKWNDQSIATKKDLVNRADLLFTAFQDASHWSSHVALLRQAKVNYKILDCSDAHHFSAAEQNERLGNCRTWLNTTPTFAGLVHALAEFDRRVYVGLEPPTLGRIRRAPERFIEQVTISSADPSTYEAFDYSVPLNPGFVAVIGNKGQGKSALLDCIALAGNSSRSNEFAFLNNKRFLSPSNRTARNYFSEIEWATGKSRKTQFSDTYDRSVAVSVEYLPQKFVERVCNADPLAGETDEFEEELRNVLFTHIPEEERAGEKSFDSLLRSRTRASRELVDRLRAGVRPLVAEYARLARFRSSNILRDVDSRLTARRGEIAAAESALQAATDELADLDAGKENDTALAALRGQSEALEGDRVEAVQAREDTERSGADLQRRLLAMDAVLARVDDLRQEVETLNAEVADLMSMTEAEKVRHIELSADMSAIESWRTEIRVQQLLATNEQAEIGSKIDGLVAQRALVDAELAVADGARELARQRVIQEKERVAQLTGSGDDEETLLGLVNLRERVVEAPQMMKAASSALVVHAQQIHQALAEQAAAVADLYGPASRFIEESAVVQTAGLQFNADLRILPEWQEITASLDGRRNGDLLDWLTAMPDRVDGADWEGVAGELGTLVSRLEKERGAEGGDFRNPDSAFRQGASLEDYLGAVFGLRWIEVRFGLTGDGLPLSKLSPGQRGLVLALFYLVVDRRTTPLLLDQPEENLDNATIKARLVSAIHEAAGRRQTIVVTHNANLAVVGDADQVIHCEIADEKFTVSSGSISELDVARHAVNVLEGTKPAFDNRRAKYEVFPELSDGEPAT